MKKDFIYFVILIIIAILGHTVGIIGQETFPNKILNIDLTKTDAKIINIITIAKVKNILLVDKTEKKINKVILISGYDNNNYVTDIDVINMKNMIVKDLNISVLPEVFTSKYTHIFIYTLDVYTLVIKIHRSTRDRNNLVIIIDNN